MPSSCFLRLKGAVWQGFQRSYVALEGGIQESVETLPSHEKLLFGNPRFFHSEPFAAFTDPNVFFRRGTLIAAQSNLNLASRRRNLSVVGALSRTFSIPSVSGPSFQVCAYHVDHLLPGPSHFPFGIGTQKVPMVISNVRAFRSGYSINNLTSRHGLLSSDSYSSFCISRSFHSSRKISMSLRNKAKPDNYVLYGYFIYHVAKRSANCAPSLGLGLKGFHILLPASFSTGTAPDVSFHNSLREEQLTNSADTSEQKTLADRSLELRSGSCYLPHPEKEETGGEDAHFIWDEQAIGVADGVGGWAELGVDAGQYARELMSNSVSAVEDEPKRSIDPARVLEKAHSSTKAKGSSTACIIALTDQGLHAINLGDSGFMVVRDGCTVFRSPAQQHDFNFTYQLENGSNGDLPSSGQVFTIPVAPGDVIIAGTDGLFDNLYNNDITAVVVHAMRAGLGPQVTAQKIAALARQRAQDKNRQTPFSAAAQEAGFRYYGGKLDDITVVVSYVTNSNKENSSA